MARPRKNPDGNFIDLTKARYDELNAAIERKREEMERITQEMKPIRTFLQSAGVIEKQRRGRRKVA